MQFACTSTTKKSVFLRQKLFEWTDGTDKDRIWIYLYVPTKEKKSDDLWQNLKRHWFILTKNQPNLSELFAFYKSTRTARLWNLHWTIGRCQDTYLIVKIKSVGLRSFLEKTHRKRSRQSIIRIWLIFSKVGSKIKNSFQEWSNQRNWKWNFLL